ncbi:MAG: hypothetical protein HZC41_07945 [Chloroflexi bacterium]|nr:hypothetical protein [Chloroflexota bacterium]
MTLVLRRTHHYIWAGLAGLGLGLVSLLSPLLALAVMVAGVFLVTALRHPTLLLYVLVAAVVFLSGMPRGDLIPLFIPNEPMLALAAGLGVFIVLMKPPKTYVSRLVFAACILLILGTAVIPLIAYRVRGFGLSTSDMFSLMAPTQYLVLAWLFAYLPDTDADRHNLVQWMLFCASIVAFIGLLQAAKVGPVVELLKQWYPSPHEEDALQLGRITSLLGAWNSLGNFLMINLIVILSLQNQPRRRLHSLNMLAALVLCGVALIASGSYASILGLLVSLFIIKVFDRRGYKVVLLLLFGLAVGAVLLQSLVMERLAYQYREGGLVPETLLYRFEVWQKVYLPIIQKNIIWGVSPTFTGYVTWGWAESQYLYLLFRSGLVSLLAHLTFVGIMLVWAYRRIRSSDGLSRKLATAVFTILLALTIMGFTNEVFTSSGAIDYVWMLIGLAAAEPLRRYRLVKLERTYLLVPEEAVVSV